jgi:RHS repeat-associated protein
MKRHITFGIALMLNLVIGTAPFAGLTSGSDASLLAKSVRTISSRNSGSKRESIKPVKSPVVSRILAKRPVSRTASEGDLPGQSITPLPDGRSLKVGGFENDGPVAIARIEDARKGGVAPESIRLQRGRAWHTATMLPDGQILIVGGIGGDGQVVETAELLRVETNTSESIGTSGLTPRVYHTATLLTDGQVLIAGGLSGSANALKSAELWDFRSGSRTRLSSRLRNARYNHTARLLSNGNVFLSGGTDNAGKPVNEGEEYIATSHRFRSSDGLLAQENEAAARIADSLPANGSADAPLDTLIALRFSKPLRPETVNAETVQLTGPRGAVEIKIVPAEGGRLAFISPATLLIPGATYTLSVSGPLDEDGSALAFSSVSFTSLRQDQPVDLSEGEEWIPDESSLRDDWRSHRRDSPWQSLPSLRAEPGVTALAGQVLRLNGRPLPNVTLTLADRTTLTDKTGRFLLTQIPAGHQSMVIDGRSANRPGKSYCMFDVGVEIEEGKTTSLSYTSWLPLEDTKHATRLDIPTSEEVVAKNPRIPSLEIRIPEGVVLRSQHGDPLTSLSITPIPLDRTPLPLPEGAKLFFSPQAHGAKVESITGEQIKGVRIIYPNISGLAPATRVDLMTYNAARGWYVYGQGEVSGDGRQIVPDSGVEFHRLGCLMMIAGSPSLAPAEWPPYPGISDGDPVDLATGLFVFSATDMALPGIIPIALTRTYRPQDSRSRAFGIGATHSYEMFIVGDYASYLEVVLPTGGRIRFNRMSSGTGYVDGVFEHTETPSGFYKSVISWNSTLFGWDLRFRDGALWHFKVYNSQIGPPVLVLIQDRYNNSLSIARDLNRKITKITSPNGRWMEFGYDASSRLTQAKDNLGRTVSYQYDGSGRLWKVTDAVGGVTEYTYDASHRMLTLKDARQITYLTNEYDTNGRVTKQTQADGTFYLFAYTLNGSGKVTRTEVTNPRGNVRRVTFNARGYVLTDTYALGNALQQTYGYERQTGTNLITSVTDQQGRRTEFTYNSFGAVTTVTRLAGTANAITASFTYEQAFNQPATVTDPLNHTTTFGYDSRGSLTSITDALNHQTTFTYNSSGQPVSATDPLNHTTTFNYDQGDLVGATSALGHMATRFIDGAGRVLRSTDPMGRAARYEYDNLNRVTKVTDPLQGATVLAYDANSNLTGVTDARSNAITYTLDNMDRVVRRRDPLMRDVTYEYNANGAVKRITDRKGQVTNYSYDALDRLNQAQFADGSTITYNYDAGNRLTSVVDSVSGAITLAYDDLDRLTNQTTPQGAVSYTYDTAGRRSTMSAPGQSQISYAYDNADRLTSITQGTATVTIAYDNAGRRTSLTLPNGVVTEYGYDSDSRLTSLTYKKSGVTLGDITYDYDPAGRRTKLGGSFARTALPQALISTSYNAANHQTVFGSQALTYDLNGSLTSDGSNTYAWNARNQLTSITGSNLIVSFQYDAFGRRISKTINGATTSLLYDGANPVQEQQSGSATANMLTGGLDQLFTRADSSCSCSAISDALGSTVALTNSSGTVQTEYSYEPFGKATISGAASNNPSKYTGREDDQTGLYFYRARYYSPTLQRFISEDPIGLAGGINLFAYAGNNPISFRDPSGLKPNDPWISEAGFCYALGACGTFLAGLYDHTSKIPGTGASVSGTARWATGADDAVDRDSGWHTGGEIAGVVAETAVTGVGAAESFAVRTPQGFAFQSLSREALAARNGVNAGATLYRGGIIGENAVVEGQYWAMESPLNPGFAQRYGLPPRTPGISFTQTGAIKPGVRFITRRAPSIGNNTGGAIEVVVPSGGVRAGSFTTQ